MFILLLNMFLWLYSLICFRQFWLISSENYCKNWYFLKINVKLLLFFSFLIFVHFVKEHVHIFLLKDIKFLNVSVVLPLARRFPICIGVRFLWLIVRSGFYVYSKLKRLKIGFFNCRLNCLTSYSINTLIFVTW